MMRGCWCARSVTPRARRCMFAAAGVNWLPRYASNGCPIACHTSLLVHMMLHWHLPIHLCPLLLVLLLLLLCNVRVLRVLPREFMGCTSGWRFGFLVRIVPDAPILSLDRRALPMQVLNNRLHELFVGGQRGLHEVALRFPLACFIEDSLPLGVFVCLPAVRWCVLASRISESTAESSRWLASALLPGEGTEGTQPQLTPIPVALAPLHPRCLAESRARERQRLASSSGWQIGCHPVPRPLGC